MATGSPNLVPLYPEQPLVPGRQRTAEDGRDLYLHLIKTFYPELGAVATVVTTWLHNDDRGGPTPSHPAIEFVRGEPLVFEDRSDYGEWKRIPFGYVEPSFDSVYFNIVNWVYECTSGLLILDGWLRLCPDFDKMVYQIRFEAALNEIGMKAR